MRSSHFIFLCLTLLSALSAMAAAIPADGSGNGASMTVAERIAPVQWVVPDRDFSQTDVASSAIDAPEASTWLMFSMGALLMAMSVLRRQAKLRSKNGVQER